MTAWNLYDTLLRSITVEDTVETCAVGRSWTCVKTAGGLLGVNATQPGELPDVSRYIGMPLKDAAALIKSWSFPEAAIGGAAINAALNRPTLLTDSSEPDAFLRYKDRLRGKKVAVVGHFAYLENRLSGLCDLFILERKPAAGDYPDPACEYLLPEMDAVFLTGSALANKTLPRLLALSRNAFTVISGPSTPMAPALFELGADALCGFCTLDSEKLSDAANECGGIFASGRMVCLER